MDKTIGFYKEVGVPGEKADAGRLGGFMLVDREAGKAITISLWETEADMKASEATSAERQRKARETGAVLVVCAVENHEVVEGS
jgi:hypothetical protein